MRIIPQTPMERREKQNRAQNPPSVTCLAHLVPWVLSNVSCCTTERCEGLLIPQSPQRKVESMKKCEELTNSDMLGALGAVCVDKRLVLHHRAL